MSITINKKIKEITKELEKSPSNSKLIVQIKTWENLIKENKEYENPLGNYIILFKIYPELIEKVIL